MSQVSAPGGLHFDEVRVGDAWTTGEILLDETSIVGFALEWDPQPFHVDKAFASTSIFGTLCASGLQTLLVTYRQFLRMGLFEGTTLAGLGLERMKLMAPVLAGDRLKVRVEVEKATPTSKPDRGLLKLRMRTLNQMNVTVSELTLLMLVRRRT